MRKTLQATLALLLAFTLLAGCSTAKPTETPKPAETPKAAEPPKQEPKKELDQTLVIGIEFEHAGNDPAIVYDNSSRIIVAMYENLVTLKRDTTEIIPQLAEKWTITPDGKKYTFNLRKGVKFHDGTEMTAEAVKLSLERLVTINKGPAWMFAGAWTSIETPDPLTVVINLKDPDAAFLAKLAGPAGPQIISAKAIKENAGSDNGQKYFNENAAGTGPYMLEKWEKGQQVIIKKFNDYWGGWQGKHLDKVVFRFIKEASTQKQLIEKGEIDIAYALPTDQLKAMKEKPPAGVIITDGTTQNIRTIVLHTNKGPTKDKKVRQALAHAVDYNGLIKNVWSNLEEPLVAALPNGDPNHYKGGWPYAYDLNKAKALLKEAGVAAGTPIKIGLFENSQVFKDIAEVLQASLKEIGFDAKIETHSTATILDLAGKQETAFEIMPIGNYPDYADSSSMLGNTYASWAWGSAGWNFSYYKNAQVDKLLKDVNLTTDAAKRAQLFQDIQKILVDEVPVIPVSTRKNVLAMRDHVKGFYMRPMMTNSFPLYEMYKEAK